ncbi:Lipid-binding SYLF domain-containing protein [Methylomagnum ishizawai]|uniref:Lipid-binding SYLF domain-containing protein n=1 Tax=Methylomagnum ishizawai TaxID=1760988 RepID=A0A1Y6D197_9GAMM|nr:YSC84-related protein [Methylomagnum ishizawai]SMF96699.1 Lipid-binding SYLF domain-containing protein [Methylomagnum ishizawai]
MKPIALWAGLLLALLFTLTGCQTGGGISRAAQLDRDADFALRKLYDSSPEARKLAARAKGILVFPDIVKGGFLFGAYYGDGVLRKHGRTVGYYNNSAFSYGLQAGVQSFGYALFFMSDGALGYLDQSNGWEIGVGPSIVIVDAGMAKSLTTTTLQHDIYGFVFDQKGLMAGLGLQGSKITRINP